MSYNKLIYGKNNKERIVGVEPEDGFCTLFLEDKNGDVQQEVVQNRWWLLSNKKLGNNWNTLKGNLHYKYGKQFIEREEFLKVKNYRRNDDIFTIFDPKESFLVNFGYTYFKGMKHKDVSILSFDIEAVGLEHNKDSKVLIISNTFRNKKGLVRKMFTYDEYETQADLINAWCKWVREVNPAIIAGHNIYTYDLPYLDFIAKREDTELLLGRNKSALWFQNKESKFRKDGSQFLHYKKPHVYGRELLDTYFLSIKYDTVAKKYESYALKKIIATEGLEVKERQHYDASQIRFTYNNPVEWEKIKRYAEFDADDALALWDLMGASYFYMCQSVPKSFQMLNESATGSQINALLIRSYLQEGHSIPKASDPVEFEGAISHGVPGIHKNVLSFDVASLYPSIMREYKVCCKEKDPEENFIKMTEYFTEERLINKKLAKETGDRYYDDLQNAQKTVINSGYGFLGAPGLNFNYPEGAAFVTEKGREILKTAIQWATGKEYEVWKQENVKDA